MKKRVSDCGCDVLPGGNVQSDAVPGGSTPNFPFATSARSCVRTGMVWIVGETLMDGPIFVQVGVVPVREVTRLQSEPVTPAQVSSDKLVAFARLSVKIQVSFTRQSAWLIMKAVAGAFVRAGAERTGAAGIVIVWAEADLDTKQAQQAARTASVVHRKRRPDMRGISSRRDRTA